MLWRVRSTLVESEVVVLELEVTSPATVDEAVNAVPALTAVKVIVPSPAEASAVTRALRVPSLFIAVAVQGFPGPVTQIHFEFVMHFADFGEFELNQRNLASDSDFTVLEDLHVMGVG